MARMSPLLPLIGGGRTKFQPVYVGDVAAAVAAGLDGDGKPGKGHTSSAAREVLSFRDLLDRTQEYADRQRGYLPMPFWLAKLQAILTSPLPNSLRPVTYDQVRLLERDNVVSEAARKDGRTLAGLGILQAGVGRRGRAHLPRALQAARAVRALQGIVRSD